MNPDIVIHIGLPKTGTTFLQQKVFPKLEGVNYLKHLFYKKDFKNFLNTNKKRYKCDNTEKYLKKDRINLISEENLYGMMFNRYDDRFTMLRRLYLHFPDAKIIIGIRDKTELLHSWYKEYIACGGTEDFGSFIIRHFNTNKLNYEYYINKVRYFFGIDNVLIYTFEGMRNAPGITIRHISNFIGCDMPRYKNIAVRASLPNRYRRTTGFINRFFRTYANPNGIIPWWGPILPHVMLLRFCLWLRNALVR